MGKETDAAADTGHTAQDDAPKTSTESTSDSKGKKRSAKPDKIVDKPDDVSGSKKAKVDEPKKANEPKKAKAKAKAKDDEASAISYATLGDARQKELQGELSTVRLRAIRD